MKNVKSLIIAVVVLLILVGGFFGLKAYNKNAEEKEIENAESASNEAETAVFSIELDDVESFGFTNDSGEECHFKKSNGVWVLESNLFLKLDQDMISGYALSFTGLTTKDIITDGNPSDFGFDNPSGEFYVSTGTETYTITYGINNSITNEYYYILNGDTSTIYYTDGGLMGYKSSVTIDSVTAE